MSTLHRAVTALLLSGLGLHAAKKTPHPEASALDRYVREATAATAGGEAASAGSLYVPYGRLADPVRDLRAAQVNDLVTIVVSERATAVAKGKTNTARKSDTKASVGSLFGAVNKAGTLANLASASGDTELQGQGETSRETSLTTTLSARVVQVLPNGYLVIEGAKDVQVNSERQQVTVRGVIRPTDLSPANQVRSDRIAQMEVRINGKGVVGDAVRRPFFLYRLLLGLLPF